jgi:hypothetical protein
MDVSYLGSGMNSEKCGTLVHAMTLEFRIFKQSTISSQLVTGNDDLP